MTITSVFSAFWYMLGLILLEAFLTIQEHHMLQISLFGLLFLKLSKNDILDYCLGVMEYSASLTLLRIILIEDPLSWDQLLSQASFEIYVKPGTLLQDLYPTTLHNWQNEHILKFYRFFTSLWQPRDGFCLFVYSLCICVYDKSRQKNI